MSRTKVGRNDKCPCGSGFKYKHCCGATSPNRRHHVRTVSFEEIPEEVRQAIIEQQRKEGERKRRYGQVRPTIALDHLGYKFVAVGNTLHYSKSWKTFHDFLVNYMAILGTEWGNKELKKSFSERHPVVQWYHHVCELQQRTIKERGKVYSAIATGPVMAYMALSYDLYTLQHHSLLQEKLIKRLKVKDQFQGARYETYVAAAFVRAGFHVVLEDETDVETSHCEFTATHERTGQQYSVEAKSRHRPGLLGRPGNPQPLEQIEADVYRLLQKALLKKAKHERAIFIDTNVPPQKDTVFQTEWFKKIAAQLKRLEDSQDKNKPWPPAFIFFTNHPYHYVGGDDPEPGRSTAFTAINIPDFKESDPGMIRKYPAIEELLDSVLNHTAIPHEF